MPVQPDTNDTKYSLLTADDGTVLARFHFEDEDTPRGVADFRHTSDVGLEVVVKQARLDLAGTRLDTVDQGLADALGEVHKIRLEMRRELTDLPAGAELPQGWSFAAPGWDEDLREALVAAYGPDHPDGSWRQEDTTLVSGMFETGEPIAPLLAASARVVDADGRSAGHVLSSVSDDVVRVLNLAVAPRAQGLGLGPALLGYALSGAKESGLNTVELGVAEGNPALRMYESAGFRQVERVFSIRL